MHGAIFTLVGPAIVLVYCFLYLLSETRMLGYAWKTRGWMTTEGTILHATIRTGPAPVWRGRGTTLFKYPDVVYRYRVGSQDYHGSHLGYCGRWSPYDLSSPWQVGQHVPIFYAPGNPADSVLQAGIGFQNVVGVLLGACGVVFAAGWMYFALSAA